MNDLRAEVGPDGPRHAKPLRALAGILLLALLLLRVLEIPILEAARLLVDARGSYTLRTVALGAITVGALGGGLGTFAVLRGQSLLGDAVSHSALPGIYLIFMLWTASGLSGASFLGLPLPLARSLPVVLFGALATGVLATLLISAVTRGTRLKEDTALGLTLATFFGAGLVLRSILQQGYSDRAGLEAFLYGSAATLSADEVRLVIGLALLVFATLALLWKEFKLLAFDPDFLAASGFPVRAIDALLTSLIVIAVIVGLQLVGVILMSAVLIAPAVAARQWSDRLEPMFFAAVSFGAGGAVVGLLASNARGQVATGPVIALFLTAIAVASVVAAPGRGLADQALERRSRSERFAHETLLLHMVEQGGSVDRARLRRQLGWGRRRLAGALRRAVAAQELRLEAAGPEPFEGDGAGDGPRVLLLPGGEARARETLQALEG